MLANLAPLKVNQSGFSQLLLLMYDICHWIKYMPEKNSVLIQVLE